ncbi:MAG: hypothetical protein A2901_05070 [Elusimicrobia bacterium RIFCSPLOWO2_01_FULL_54_10]|nr:MAG: hypothetical protein A2901_05070 [Elusimicrobia bacterium RIFCSPLOWO2_01_FULL_54_10]
MPSWTPAAASLVPGLIAASLVSLAFAKPGKMKFWLLAIVPIASALAAAGFVGLEASRRFLFMASAGANVFGASIFVYSFSRWKGKNLLPWATRLEELKKSLEREEAERLNLIRESESLESETQRSVKTYRVVKGLGEALNWEEMAPHMDFAIQQCMGFKDYILYLADENSALQKVLFRGARMADAPEQPSSASKWHARSHETYLEIPIRHGGRMIALLWMRASPAMAARPKEEILAEADEISEELVMGLEKARLFSSLERLSRLDGLTGVHRRKVFDDRLLEEIRRAKAFRTNFSVLICDLDHFKNINDTYGHQAGDEVLKRVGRLMQESVYETDFVARYGGEEFVILLPQADPKGVQRKAETIRQRMEAEKFTFGWNELKVTVSIGISHFPGNGTDAAALLAAADSALYAAKGAGRNRVVDASQIW